MKLRLAQNHDLDQIEVMLEDARAFLKASGSSQWQSGSPNREVFAQDIANGTCYVLEDQKQVIAVATLLVGPDPSYAEIRDGSWLQASDNYIAIHRVVTSGKIRGKGLGKIFLQMLLAHIQSQGFKAARIDTFRINYPMQKVATKVGFNYCGLVTVDDPIDGERLAYEVVF
ncbi:GNAT family N-acetyltransferase [Ligilactobacillus equi]|uniref:N-acetyltransferase GCN5 n=1 Tax=Ligilactobacillus equi DSM 15833 = JCM 10991 TaxID=1423740 RepID=A0A0R1T7Z9_9LACO|nr:GNAT family N-acetyltransferase [Ligilactobacillus equi]KRL76276.1 N-acetyltransferase GCN5 [Ligilactobacillus equi DSM 15833 = JCM 10991]